MEAYANKQGQTVIHLSKDEWQDYGRQAGYEEQSDTVPQELSGLIGEMLVAYQESNPEWENDDTYKKLEAKAGEAKDLLINMDKEDPNKDIMASDEKEIKEAVEDDEGLIGPFKLRACDDIIDRKSRRGRKFDDGEEVVNPFMRSMPY